jgi:serine/threonine protein kinase
MMFRNRYWLVRTVGKGGFAVVYEAIDTQEDRRVAIKEIPLVASGHDDQVAREIHILSTHVSDLPFVPAIYDYWSEHGQIFLVMEWIDGPTVWELRNNRWSPAQVEHFLRTLLGYLAELHTRGIIHRDLHPKNIKLDPQKQYVLLDFGIAKEGMQTLSMAKAAQPRYAPLEQLTGDPTDARSDLYTLGATAYHLLTGAPPPTALERRYDGVPLRPPRQLVPNVPPALETTLVRMLELKAGDRPATAPEALRMLDQPLAPTSAPGLSRQPAPPQRPAVPTLQPSRRAPQTPTSWGCIWLTIIPLILLVIGSAWFADRFGSTIDSLIGALEPARAARVPATIAIRARPTELPQAVPSPTELLQAAPTLLPPTETPRPVTPVRSGMHSVTTTKGLDDRYQPLDVTSTFTANERVYISYQISEAQPGESVRFKCFFNDVLLWEGVNQIAAGGDYTGYFVIEPLHNPGVYRGELAYKGEIHTLSWDVR